MKHLLYLILSIFCISCSTPRSGSDPEILAWPEVEFARQHLEASISGFEVDLNLKDFLFELDTLSLKEQDYRIAPGEKKVKITGGGARGLMYGGLEAAEQIGLYGKVSASTGSPFIKKRGIKFNIPLDARTPSYDDSGDAAQENIAEMWNWAFWEEFLDQMALFRYNVLSLWNPHPFPSMINLESYPDVALQDVYRTTLEPVGWENEWGDPGLVTSNVSANLEKVVEITMEEKISFWKKVMRHARNRGIDIYWINWNICPNSVAPPVEPYYKTYQINLHEYEVGKHGITYEISNPITIDYYRQAVRTFLETYPDVKGIGVTAGEHMPLSWGGYNREKWLWETYGLGILDAKAANPDRQVDFIHRVWHSDMDQIMNYWGDYPDPFQVSFKYAKARLYSSPDLHFADSHVEEMEPYGLSSWWNLRNDDMFVYRWGDPDYVRDFLKNMPEENTEGYYMGSDGYVWGREFISKDSRLSGQLEIKKHWYNFLMWGRLGYDQGLDESYFIKKLEQSYGLEDGTALYGLWKTASGIIPLVNRFHWRDWDHHWSVESCQARPVLGGYRDVFDFMDNPTLERSGILNPREYVNGKSREGEGRGITPLEIAASLEHMADEVLQGAHELENGSRTPDYQALIDDLLAQAMLGNYYASKIRAAVGLASFELSGNSGDKKEVLLELEASQNHWLDYAEISVRNYRPQMLARVNRMDWYAVADSIQTEINQVKRYIK